MLHAVTSANQFLGVIEVVSSQRGHILLEGWVDDIRDATLFDTHEVARKAAHRYSAEATILALEVTRTLSSPCECEREA